MKIKWFYKGIRVREWHRKIVCRIGVLVLTMPMLILMCIKLWRENFHVSKEMILQTMGIGLLISLVLSLLMWHIWFHLYNIQKLCQMSFDAMYYNLEGETVNGKIVSSRKDRTYFPKIYYRYNKKKQVIVSVKLDGSKFHEKMGEMGDKFRQMFDKEVTSTERKYWYMVYTLEEIIDSRLHLGKDEIKYGKTEIPLMKGLVWDFRKAPHALITGITGGGKSFVTIYLIISFAKMGVEVRIIDPKRSDLYKLRRVYGEKNVVYKDSGAARMCRELVEEMERRYELLDDAEIGADFVTMGFQPIMLIFDEFMAFLERTAKPEVKKEIMSYLMCIILEGRQAGIDIIFATQRADASYLPGAIRDNLGMRLSVGSLEKAGYRMTFGDIDRKLEKFGVGHGYTYIAGMTREVREFYAVYIDQDYDVLKELKEILNRREKPAVPSGRHERQRGGESLRVSESVRTNEQDGIL